MSKINYFNYFTEIEDFFLKKRGKGVLISPLDWTLIEIWKDMGIPLNVVLRGIERAFSSFEKKKNKYSTINSLFYCNQSVLEEFEKYILSGQESLGEEDLKGKTDVDSNLKDKFKEYLEGLLLKIPTKTTLSSGKELFDRIKVRVKELEEEIETLKDIDIERIEMSFKEIDELIVEYLEKSIDRETMQEIKREVRKELSKYRGDVPGKMFDSLKKNFFKKKLKEKFGIGRISILEIV